MTITGERGANHPETAERICGLKRKNAPAANSNGMAAGAFFREKNYLLFT